MTLPQGQSEQLGSYTIATLAFSPIAADARVLRQSAFLSELGTVVVHGYGDAGPLPSGATLHPIAPPERDGLGMRMRRALLLLLGRLGWHAVYDRLYWSYDLYRRAAAALEKTEADLFVANDWTSLPAVARAAARLERPFLLDLHEFGPRQWDHRRLWRILRAPMVSALLERYAQEAFAAFTVNAAIARLYRDEFGFEPRVLRNIPARTTNAQEPEPARTRSGATVRMIHHGAAIPARELERMIDVMPLLPDRFELDFMLIPTSPTYLRDLEARARTSAPNRVRFRPPVAPADIIRSIQPYDIGLFLLPPTTTNYALALPNKLFDFIAAGLAVVIGPSPEMARLLQEEDCGKIAADFSVEALAACLQMLDSDDIDRLKSNARDASTRLHARGEHAAMLDAARAALSTSMPASNAVRSAADPSDSSALEARPKGTMNTPEARG